MVQNRESKACLLGEGGLLARMDESEPQFDAIFSSLMNTNSPPRPNKTVQSPGKTQSSGSAGSPEREEHEND